MTGDLETALRTRAAGRNPRKLRSRRRLVGNPPSTPAPPKPRSPRIAAVLLSALVLLAMMPSATNGSVQWDDQLYLAGNPTSQGLSIRSIAFAFTDISTLYWHPLTWLSHALDAELFGISPGPRHLTSVLLHSITAGFLCLVFFRLGAGILPAAAGALLWAVHPLRVESVAWIAERKDVLCALFFVLTLAAYLRYAETPSRTRYAAWVGCGALALMSKPAAITLPVILLLMDYLSRRRASHGRLIAEKLPLAAMSAVVAALTILGQAHAGALTSVPAADRVANAVVGYARYLGMMAWPVDLACFYPYATGIPAVTVVSAALLLGTITTAAVLQRKRRPYILAGWLWFVVALLPNAGLIQAGKQSAADRFTHLPMIGISLVLVFAAAELLERCPEWRKPAAAAACGVLVVLALLSVRQIGYWRDSETLFRRAVAVQDSGWARQNLAAALMRRQRFSEAKDHLLAAVRREPSAFEHHNNLANVLLKMNDPEGAVREARIAARLNPENRSAAETLGLALLPNGEHAAAIEAFDAAVRLGGDPIAIATLLNDNGASLASRRNFPSAELLVRKALALNPALPQARRNLALLLSDQGRPDEAREVLQQAIRETGARVEYRDLQAEIR